MAIFPLNMKPSSYNVFLAHEDDLLVYNLFTQALLRFPASQADLIKFLIDNPDYSSGSDSVSSLQECLLQHGIIINNSDDELQQLRDRWSLSKRHQGSFGLQVGTTLQCNFRCPYCYENHESIALSEVKQKSLISFVNKNCQNWTRFAVNWFGGEPLLEPEVIDYLGSMFQKACEDSNTFYDAAIITNGYLLNAQTADILRRGKVRQAQITIDGDQTSHDSRRYHANGKGTYDRIVSNLCSFGHIFDVVRLRVNIEDQPISSIERMLYDLLPIQKRVVIGFRSTVIQNPRSDSDYNSTTNSCKVGLVDEATALAIRCGYKTVSGLRHPGQIHCTAYSDNYLLLDARGDLHKCVRMAGKTDARVGFLSDEGRLILDNSNEWRFNPFEDKECAACEFLPVCMGGCQLLSVLNKNESGRCSVKEVLASSVLAMIQS